MPDKTENLELNISYAEQERTVDWIDGIDDNFEILDATIGAVIKGISDAGVLLSANMDLIDDFSSGFKVLSSTLPVGIDYEDIKVGRIKKNLYLFIGSTTSCPIYLFDTSNLTLTDTQLTLPKNLVNFSLESDGTSIYILGGKESNNDLNTLVYSFNGATFTTYETELIEGKYKAQSMLIGNDIYLFSGYNSENNLTRDVIKFNISSGESSNLGNLLPNAILNFTPLVENGSGYLLGGLENGTTISNKVYRFNAQQSRITLASFTLPESLSGSCILEYYDRTYLIGGKLSSGESTKVYKVNILSGSFIEQIGLNLPIPLGNSTYSNANYKGYIFGGISQGVGSNKIIRYIE